MKRKFITLSPDTLHVLDMPCGDRLAVHIRERRTYLDLENRRSMREAVESGDVTLRGFENVTTDLASLRECLEGSATWLESLRHHLSPSQQSKLDAHLEIARITLTPNPAPVLPGQP